MFDLNKWQEILETISKNKLRTVLTAFSVSWGIFMLILLLGFGNGLQNGVKRIFRDDATNSLWIYSGKTSLPHKGLAPGREIKFKNEDYDLIKNDITGIEHITARYTLRSGIFVNYKNESASFDIRSTHPAHRYLENTIMMRGRFLNDGDLSEFRKVAVIGNLVEDRLFKEEEPIGKYIGINGVKFKVVGVFEDQGGENEQRKIYIPISTAQRAFNANDRIHQIMLTTEDTDIASSLEMERAITASLADKYKFSMEDPRAIRIRNNLENFKRFADFFISIEIFIWIVGIGTIIAGIVGVSNIMLITVKERTKEIGVRKAIGATPWNVISLILMEAVLITVLAGYSGLIVGIGLLELFSYGMAEMNIETDYFNNPEVDFSTAVSATILLIIAGTLAGFFPARKAANINPIEALRDE